MENIPFTESLMSPFETRKQVITNLSKIGQIQTTYKYKMAYIP